MGGDHVKNESVQPVGYILFSKDNGIILKHTIIKYLGDSISLLNESTIFNNQQISPSNIYGTVDLVSLVILLEKNHSSPH